MRELRDRFRYSRTQDTPGPSAPFAMPGVLTIACVSDQALGQARMTSSSLNPVLTRHPLLRGLTAFPLVCYVSESMVVPGLESSLSMDAVPKCQWNSSY